MTNEILSVVFDVQRLRTSLASLCAGYDCPVYPVLFNNDTCFMISGEISCAYGLQSDVILRKIHSLRLHAAQVYSLTFFNMKLMYK